jgi:hypothetical protein
MTSRFHFTNSLAAPGFSFPIGIKDVGMGDQRGLIQIIENNGADGWRVKIEATTVFSFDAATPALSGTSWVDITKQVREEVIATGNSEARFDGNSPRVFQGGGNNTFIQKPGMYFLPDGFFPSAVRYEITQIDSGDLTIALGF